MGQESKYPVIQIDIDHVEHFEADTRSLTLRREAGRPRPLRDFEDQIFSVLMEAIMRAERQASPGDSTAGTQTNFNDDEE